MEEKGLPWYLGVNALVPALSSESLCFAANWIKDISGRKKQDASNRPDSQPRNPLTKFIDWLFPEFFPSLIRECLWRQR